jgi:hypothetical protein
MIKLLRTAVISCLCSTILAWSASASAYHIIRASTGEWILVCADLSGYVMGTIEPTRHHIATLCGERPLARQSVLRALPAERLIDLRTGRLTPEGRRLRATPQQPSSD